MQIWLTTYLQVHILLHYTNSTFTTVLFEDCLQVIVFSLCSRYMSCFEINNNPLSVPGMVAALTNESATSKSVYFAHCTSEMIFITHLLTEQPEKLAGPLLADTYVTLLKGRNAWYGQMLAKGELSPDMGDSIKGKGMIQVIS